MSLKEKTINGVLWTFADLVLVKGLSFVAMLFLARWLGPKDFGLVGMVAVFIAIGTILVDSGLAASLIRTPKVDTSDYSTLFFVNLGISIIAYGVLYVLAPWIAVFFEQDILVLILRVYCLSFILAALTSVQLAILQKEMAFKRLTLLNIPSTIIGVVVGLVMGYNEYGVWSIVFMYLTNQVILLVLLWLTSSWKPSLLFSTKKLKQHFNFGYKLMLSGLLNTVFTNSYHVVIGKFFPVQSLGFYERAQRFNEYPSMTITGVIEKVTFPMLSQLQDNVPTLAVIYRKILKITFFITAPLMLGAAAIAEPLFLSVLGEEWLPAVPYFQILTLAYMLYPLHAFNLNILKVFGRSDLFLRLEVIKKVILVMGIVIGFQFGILGILWSAVATSFIALFINMHYSSRLIAYPTQRQIVDMIPILLIALGTGLMMFVMGNAFKKLGNTLQIVLPSVIGVVGYLLVYALQKSGPLYLLIDLVKKKKL